jgi:hypothetical protein
MKLRMRTATAVASVILAAASLVGCSTGSDTEAIDAGTSSSTSAAVTVSATQTAAEVLAANQDDDAEEADSSYQESDVVDITLSGTSAKSSGDGITIKGSTVTITAGGTYRLRGTLTDGQIVVDAADATVKLVLDGADISSSTTAAIAATAAEKLVVILADGSKNTLADSDSYADDAEVNAALFSAADLTIAGTGALTVNGKGNDGITGKDGVVIESGNVTVNALDDGIRGKDYLVINGGTLAVTSGGDGLKADNDTDADSGYISLTGGTVKITAQGDGADATTDLVVTGGTLDVLSGGGSTVGPNDETSTKGLRAGVISVLEAGTIKVNSADDAVHSDGAVHLNGADVSLASGDDGVHAETTLVIDDGTVKLTSTVEGLEAAHITVNGGDVRVVSSDDGVNASGSSADTADSGGGFGGGGGGEDVGDFSWVVTGGTLVVDSQGDGLDSNGTASISGGSVVVNGPEQGGNGALDVNGTFDVTGGVLLAAGSSGMAVAPSTDSEQAWLSATLDSTVAAGTTLQVVDSGGKVVATFVTSKSMQSLVFSSNKITSGKEYKIYSGGTASGTSIGGLAASGELGSATAVATVTSGVAPAGGGFGGGGGRGR